MKRNQRISVVQQGIVCPCGHTIPCFVSKMICLLLILVGTNKSIEMSAATLHVSFPSIEGYTLLDSNGNRLSKDQTISYGTDLVFKIQLDAAYSQSVPIVDGATFNAITGSYTIPNITTDLQIKISGITKNIYSILFSSPNCKLVKPDGSDFKDTDLKVTHGEKFEFCIRTDYLYNLSKVMINSSPMPPGDIHNGVYVLDPVTEDKTIEVIVIKKKCIVNFFNDEGETHYTLVSSDGKKGYIFESPYGEDFQFRFQLDEAYSQSTPVINGVEYTVSDNGLYTIHNITSDKSLLVSGITKNTYNISLPPPTNGYSLVKPDGSDFEATDLKVTHGENFQFRLQLDPAYERNDPQVRVTGESQVLQPDPDGIYTLLILKNTQLELYNPPPPPPDPIIPIIYYTVSIPAIEGAVTTPMAGSYLVEEGQEFYFYLTLDEDYNQSKPVITTDSEMIISQTSDGAYIIEWVYQPIKINITGIVKNPPSVGNTEIGNTGIGVEVDNGMLSIFTLTTRRVRIFTFSGNIYKDLGEMNGRKQVSLPKGPYIVKVGDHVFKIVL